MADDITNVTTDDIADGITGPIIIIDTRERLPYEFPGCQVERKGLATGDYSLKGLETAIAIERKTKSDMYGCIGSSRARFIRELKRLTTYRYGAIVLESSLSEMTLPPMRLRVTPQAAIGSLISWSVHYGVHIWLAEDRITGALLTRRLLEKFWKHHGPKKAD